MINKEGSAEILNFMTLEAVDFVLWCDHISHIVSIFLLKSFLFPFIDHIIIVMITKLGSTEILTFMTPGQLFLYYGLTI